MVLVAVDDLLFSSKIRATAKAVGVDLVFARTPTDILNQARTLKPSLVIFDLNSARMRPLDALAQLKADPQLASVRTLGYVAHADSATIDAARASGIDQVMARSAFVNQLGSILTSE